MVWDGDDFARRLRVLMAERGLQPKQLASTSGLSRAQVGRMLRGRRSPPSRPEIEAVARALAVDPSALDASTRPDGGTGRLGPLEAELLDRFQQALDELAAGVAEVTRYERALDARLGAIETALRRQGLL